MLEGYQPVDTGTIGEYALPTVEGSPHQHIVSVVDNAAQYVELMQSLFDFDQIAQLLKRPGFTICFDGMHGVAGPYA